MPARAELTLAALGLIHHTSADSLRQLASDRGITPDSNWSVYDVAKALIDPKAVWRQLTHLDRDTLEAIDEFNRGDTESQPAVPEILLDKESRQLRPEVRHTLEVYASQWSVGRESLEESSRHTADPGETTEHSAFSASLPRIVDVLDELVLVIELVGSVRVSQRTSASTGLAKSLTHIAPDISANWEEAIDWGVWSGLVIFRNGEWWLGEHATGFLTMDRAHQLAFLVTSWWEGVDDGIRAALGALVETGGESTSLADYLPFRYPLIDTADLNHLLGHGQALGVVASARPTALLRQLIEGGDVTATIDAALPASAPGVYPDSVDSVVGAGPLSVEQKQTLALVARCVRPGMAPRWVICRDVALSTLGHTSAKDIVARLDGIIIGGLPGGLRAQLEDWETRAQSLAVSATANGTSVHCTSNYLSELLLADQKLQPLQLSRRSDLVVGSKRDVIQTRQFLLDAGYPTFPPPVAPGPSRVWVTAEKDSLPESWWEDIVTSAQQMSVNAVWAEDVLREAISDRTLLTLTVSARGQERKMVVEPRSIAGNRLRVKDTAADVERTLPLDTIVSIEPAQPDSTKTA